MSEKDKILEVLYIILDDFRDIYADCTDGHATGYQYYNNLYMSKGVSRCIRYINEFIKDFESGDIEF